MRRTDWRAVHQVAAWCLGYPDEELLERVPLLRLVLGEQRRGARSAEPVRLLSRFVDHLESGDPDALRAAYVETFDLDRRHTLYLSYWTDGDTRRRGETIAAIKRRYRASGWLVDTRGDLPDHLPMMLEYAALADPLGGRELLQAFRPSLELVRIGLAERTSPYADVLTAVCTTLPGRSPRDRAEAMTLAPVPPQESVGLEPSMGPPMGPPMGSPTAPVLLGFPTRPPADARSAEAEV